MSSSEEETYSIIFNSLKHPARRKILRMLSDKPRSFTEIWDTLEISSSHVTYHLEHLGDLVTKMKNGKYKLSTFGAAAVLTMKGVEDAPDIKSKNPLYLPTSWKPVFAVLMIGIVILAAISYIQTSSLSEVNALQERLENQLSQLTAENNRLLSWDSHLNSAKSFLQDVVQLDLTQYAAVLVTNTLEFNPEFGGVAEEILRYTLTSNNSELDVDFRFRNQTLSRFRMNILEGQPIYKQTRTADFQSYVSSLIEKCQTYSGASYLGEMQQMLDNTNEAGATETIEGNQKLTLHTEGDETEISWFYTKSGIDYQAKGVQVKFEDNTLEELTDGYYLYQIASTDINISEQEAINIATEYAKTISWTANNQKISNFTILPDSAEANLYPHPREPLKLIPYWYVTLQLDQVYPGNIDKIAVGLWADTGEVSGYQLITAE